MLSSAEGMMWTMKTKTGSTSESHRENGLNCSPLFRTRPSNLATMMGNLMAMVWMIAHIDHAQRSERPRRCAAVGARESCTVGA